MLAEEPVTQGLQLADGGSVLAVTVTKEGEGNRPSKHILFTDS